MSIVDEIKIVDIYLHQLGSALHFERFICKNDANMWREALLIYLLCHLCCYINGDEILRLNLLAKHSADVSVINHNQHHRQVSITMNANRLCKEPIFRVRLSGTSLYILDIMDDTEDHGNFVNTYHFEYPPLIDVGTYFLEVLLLACELVKPNAFADQCLEDPQEGKNILTLPYSFQVESQQVSKDQRPRWQFDANMTPPTMLRTRYQRNNCGGLCRSKEVDIQQYNAYSWVDKPDYLQLLKSVFDMSLHNTTNPNDAKDKIVFCMIGASHARHLMTQGKGLKIENVEFVHVDSRFPFQFDAHLLTDCSYAVLGYGQWLLSWVMGRQQNLYTADMYETEMREVLRRVHQSNASTQVFVRSMNYQGLGTWYTSCPAYDHRFPQHVDMYNRIVRSVFANSSVNFIDTTHVQGLMWDGALDYNHCTAKVFTAEIEHIMHHALSHSLQYQRTPVLVSGESPRGTRNTLVKFSDANTVYLHAGGVMRAFPDTESYTTLGYKRSEVLSYGASTRQDFEFGSDLHLVRTVSSV